MVELVLYTFFLFTIIDGGTKMMKLEKEKKKLQMNTCEKRKRWIKRPEKKNLNSAKGND